MTELKTDKKSNSSLVTWAIQSIKNLHISGKFIYLPLLLIITAIAFSPALSNSFTNWDDPIYVLNNQLIRSISWQNICHIFSPTTFSCGNYHPVTILSLAINYNIGQLDPFGYILFNLIVHLCSVCLVFGIIHKLFKNDLVAFICTILFAIHPMNVEPVAWVAGRKDVLFVFFYLASIIVYLQYVEKAGKKKVLSYLGVFILFATSLLSKGTAVTMLAILFLIDYYKGRKFSLTLVLEKVPFIIISILIIILEMKSQREYGAVAPSASFAVMQKRFIICYGYDLFFYISRYFAPVNLSVCYPNIVTLPNKLPIIDYAGLIGFFTILALDLFLIKRNKIIFFGLTFFLIAISTALHFRFVSAGTVADRYTYIPYIGISIIIAYYFEKAISGEYLKKLRNIIIAVGILVILIFSYSTYARCKIWENTEVLFTDVINKYPNIPVAYTNRGSYYFNNTLYNEAIKDYSKAIKLDSNYSLAYYNRGTAYHTLEKLDSAINDYGKAIQFNSGYFDAYYNRGIAYMNEGKTINAIIDYTRAIALNPNNIEAYNNRGMAFIAIDSLADAINDLNIAIKLDPYYTMAYYNRGIAFKAKGDFDSAINDFSNIIQLLPEEAEMYHQRGECYEMKGLLKERDSDFEKYNKLKN